MWVALDYRFTGQTMTTDDPRMTGTRTEYHNTVTLSAVLVTISNADETWNCPSYAVAVDPVGPSLAGWCEGSGAYDGLRAYVAYDPPEEGKMSVDVYGLITSGDGRPMPEPPAG